MPVHKSANVADGVTIPDSASVWHHAHIREGSVIGESVSIGKGAYIGVGVRVGAKSKIQNYALVYEPADLEEGVFIGPAAVLTNDRLPRAITPTGMVKSSQDWDVVGVRVLIGASIGAGAICVAPVTIGRWAMVGAGAIVTSDVPDYGLVVGSPARRIGWVGRAGERLDRVVGLEREYVSPVTAIRYREIETGLLVEVDPP